ncbi:MAG TPA: DsrE family protein [Thermoanaerobaculia bacterium]|nr:DsrE family protein [Thermoanaerobaculia bacterium]
MTAKQESPARPFWVLLLQRDSEDVLYEAAAMTAAAVSLGIDVTLIWFDAALEALASGRLAEEEAEAGNAGRLLREAREAGSVRLLACSASMVNRSIDRDRLSRCVDDIVGWPTAISLIRSAERSFIW